MNTGAFAALSSQIWQIISTPLKMTTALGQFIPHFPSVTSLLKRTAHTTMGVTWGHDSEPSTAASVNKIQLKKSGEYKGSATCWFEGKLALLCVQGRQCQTASGEWQACRRFNIMQCHAGEEQWQEQPSRWTLQSQSYYPIATWGFPWLRWWESAFLPPICIQMASPFVTASLSYSRQQTWAECRKPGRVTCTPPPAVAAGRKPGWGDWFGHINSKEHCFGDLQFVMCWAGCGCLQHSPCLNVSPLCWGPKHWMQEGLLL